MPVLATIGYEKAHPSDFLATLRAARVEVVVDVRAVPNSRRRDFARGPLAAALAVAGIRYAHLPALGTPKPGRDAARAGDRAGFERVMAAHLDGEEAQADLARLAGIAAAETACLLCLEADPARCHRSLVAERLARRMEVEVRHLFVRPGAASQEELPGLP